MKIVTYIKKKKKLAAWAMGHRSSRGEINMNKNRQTLLK